MELIDIVDENVNFTGQVTDKEEATFIYSSLRYFCF